MQRKTYSKTSSPTEIVPKSPSSTIVRNIPVATFRLFKVRPWLSSQSGSLGTRLFSYTLIRTNLALIVSHHPSRRPPAAHASDHRRSSHMCPDICRTTGRADMDCAQRNGGLDLQVHIPQFVVQLAQDLQHLQNDQTRDNGGDDVSGHFCGGLATV